MKTAEKTMITVEALINAPVEKVWEFWTDPKHIIRWNYASADWHTTRAESNLKPRGRFLSRMEARDGSNGFDFTGTFEKVKQYDHIEYTLDDERKVNIFFKRDENSTIVKEIFEAENDNSEELQREGWQAILNNFKDYVEASGKFEKLHFEISINAGAATVYQTMIDDQKWKEWTSGFNPDSKFVGSWEKGSKIVFLGTGEDGKIGGMSSRIRENIPNKFISIEHLATIQNGKEIKNSPGTSDWSGALENYTFNEMNGCTILSVETDSPKEFLAYFEETWPIALRKLKEICER